MAVLKKYVRKRSRPEGCIAKGYGTEEVIEFCVDYLPDLNPIGLPVSHHEGRLKGKGTLGKKFSQANFTVLQNSSKVAPYIDEHMNIIQSENPQKNLAWITRPSSSSRAARSTQPGRPAAPAASRSSPAPGISVSTI